MRRSPQRAPTLYSSETGRSYLLDRLVGKGGFGEIYLATPEPAGALPARVCVKITYRMTGWLREAYFAELLGRQPRALKIFDRFVHVEPPSTRYCLVMEYAEHGDLSSWLAQKGAQPERFVRQEIAAILQPLNVLHRGQALHRDLTPFNVFVCEDECLKLGDFGIATHQASRRASGDRVGQSPEMAAARRRLSGRPADRHAAARRRARADAQPRRAAAPLQRSSQGSDPSVSRRARQALRVRLGADRRPATRAEAAAQRTGRKHCRPADLVHGVLAAPAARGNRRGEEIGRDLPGKPGSLDRHSRARSPERTPSRRQGRRAEAHGDQ